MPAKRLWVLILVAALVAAFVGPGMVGATETRAVLSGAVMMPAAAAIPVDENVAYERSANVLRLTSGDGNFIIPVPLPVPAVTLKRITVFALDNSANEDITVTLVRTYPPDGSAMSMLGSVVTLTSVDNPQVVTTSQISPRLLTVANYGLFLWIYISGPGVWLYGVKVLYNYEV